MFRPTVVLILPLFLLVPARGQVATQPASTQPVAATQPAQRFLRFVDHGQAGSALETEEVTYGNDKGQTVRLVAAVHIAEKSYFEALNKSFEQDEAVLYELVKDKDAAVPAPDEESRSDNPINQFQHFLKDALKLEFQLDAIDYNRRNFVHADLDAQTFARMQEERGESMLTLMLRQMLDALSRPQPAGGNPEQTVTDLISLLTRPDAERQMKLLLARQMGDIENLTLGLDGPGGSVILTERNKAAIEVLKTTLAKGKNHVSIFYGAAHMPDLEKRLLEIGFRPVSRQWRQAWDVTIRPNQPSALESLLRQAFEGMKERE